MTLKLAHVGLDDRRAGGVGMGNASWCSAEESEVRG